MELKIKSQCDRCKLISCRCTLITRMRMIYCAHKGIKVVKITCRDDILRHKSNFFYFLLKGCILDDHKLVSSVRSSQQFPVMSTWVDNVKTGTELVNRDPNLGQWSERYRVKDRHFVPIYVVDRSILVPLLFYWSMPSRAIQLKVTVIMIRDVIRSFGGFYTYGKKSIIHKTRKLTHTVGRRYDRTP